MSWKKVIIITGILFTVTYVGGYIAMPSQWIAERTVSIRCNPDAAFRALGPDTVWKNLLSPLEGLKCVYRVGGKQNRKVELIAETQGGTFSGILSLLSQSSLDSCIVQWRYVIPSGGNPFGRIHRMGASLDLTRDMEVMLGHLRDFLEQEKNVYGMEVRGEMSHDSMLVVKQWEAAAYPGTTEIYAALAELRAYMVSQRAKEIDPPMLHVQAGPGGRFEVMTAIPVDRELKGKGDIFLRRFVPWKVLAGEVRGGAYRAEQAGVQLQYYIQDHQRTSMAIPFQSLVTERDKEKDSTRWVTRVIEPVF